MLEGDSVDERLRERLSKLEALFARAGTAGEQAAAGAAIERLRGRVGREPILRSN